MEAEYLYHYTNTESLALILKNRTIRFNSLDRMDDLQENKAFDVNNFGRYIYISSWTSENTESIPMWNMYASLSHGVRIKLKKNPFKIYDNDISELPKIPNLPIGDGNSNSMKTIIPLKELFEKGFFSDQIFKPNSLLFEVQYTSDIQKLEPKLLQDNKSFSSNVMQMGIYKNKYWEFQGEWRYILNIFPLNKNDASIDAFAEIVNKIRLGVQLQPFPYYDLKIDKSAFSDMEITLSPRISAGNRTIVDTLVSRFNPSAKIIESALKDLI